MRLGIPSLGTTLALGNVGGIGRELPRRRPFQNGAGSEVWTHRTWTVTPGPESDFVRAWEELGDWGQGVSGGPGTLLRDTERPNVFIRFGPCPDRDTAARWRASDEFQTRPRPSASVRRPSDSSQCCSNTSQRRADRSAPRMSNALTPRRPPVEKKRVPDGVPGSRARYRHLLRVR